MSYSCTDFTSDVLNACVQLGFIKAEEIEDDNPEQQARLVVKVLNDCAPKDAKLAARLMCWAQNEEMVDQYYTQHGKDCIQAAKLLGC